MIKSKPSQTQRILSVLQKGKTLSVLQAEKMNIGNIRARMTDLRKAGHNIIATKNTSDITAYKLA